MTTPARPSPIGPAVAAPVIDSAELYAWIARRRRTQRRMVAVAVVVIALAVAAVTAYWVAFSRHLLAKGYLESHVFTVDWQIEASNLWAGGITSVAYRPGRWVWNKPVSAVDLQSLKGLNHLRSLDLTGLDWLKDDELAVVAALPELEELELNRVPHEFTPITTATVPLSDRVLDDLKALGRLKSLGLSGNRITDAGLAKLANLQALEVLDLDGTYVTDDGLDALAGLKSLRTLRVVTSKVTSRGVARFQRKRPDVEVIREISTDAGGTPLP